jgi:hypothetical protein
LRKASGFIAETPPIKAKTKLEYSTPTEDILGS